MCLIRLFTHIVSILLLPVQTESIGQFDTCLHAYTMPVDIYICLKKHFKNLTRMVSKTVKICDLPRSPTPPQRGTALKTLYGISPVFFSLTLSHPLVGMSKLSHSILIKCLNKMKLHSPRIVISTSIFIKLDITTLLFLPNTMLFFFLRNFVLFLKIMAAENDVSCSCAILEKPVSLISIVPCIK